MCSGSGALESLEVSLHHGGGVDGVAARTSVERELDVSDCAVHGESRLPERCRSIRQRMLGSLCDFAVITECEVGLGERSVDELLMEGIDRKLHCSVERFDGAVVLPPTRGEQG